MTELHTRLDETERAIGRSRARVAIILGSGFSPVTESVTAPKEISYAALPHFKVPAVAGHRGRLLLGTIAGVEVLVFEGRKHLYEGISASEAAYPVYVARRLGVETLVVTNAAGGVNAAYEPGDLMVITDHLNLLGTNPLLGANDDELGPRFPAMLDAYDQTLARTARLSVKRHCRRAHAGVYAAMLGPNFETMAELRMLRTLGADAVGMSTVPEVIAARHCGMRVLGLSVIANCANPDRLAAKREVVDHTDVTRVVGEAAVKVADVLRDVLGTDA